MFFFFSSRRRHTRFDCDWSSDVCSSDLEHVQMRSYNPNYDGHPGQIKRAAKLLARAKKPVLYVGGGVISADASAELMELAELWQLPVTQTLMGLGSFPIEHPLSLDMLGMHGSYYANMAGHHSH